MKNITSEKNINEKPDSLPKAQWLSALLLITALYLGVGVFDHNIWAPTEPAVSGVVWNMFTHGDIAIPRIHEFNYLEKPPLNYWASLLVCKIAGSLDAGWIRLPSAIYGIMGLLITIWALRKRVSSKTLPSLLLLAATGGYYYELSHRASSDTPAMFFAFVSWAAFTQTIFLDDKKTTRRLIWDILFCVILSISFYAKNFFTHLVVLPPVFLFMIWKKDFKRCFSIGLMMAVFSLLFIAPWAALLYERGGWNYLRVVFVDNTFGRLLPLADMSTKGVTPLNDAWIAEKGMHPLLYLETLIYCTIPWTLFYVVATTFLFRKKPRDDFRLFLRIALISVPVVLTLSASRVVEYLAPILFILFLIAGDYLDEWMGERLSLSRWERRCIAINAILVATLMTAVIAALAFYVNRPILLLWVIPGALYPTHLFLCNRHKTHRLIFNFLFFAAFFKLVITANLYPALDEIKSFQFFFDDIRAETEGRELYTTFRDDLRLPQITYYLNQRVPIINESEIEELIQSGRNIGLILPPHLHEQHQELFEQTEHTLIKASRGRKAYVFVGIPVK